MHFVFCWTLILFWHLMHFWLERSLSKVTNVEILKEFTFCGLNRLIHAKVTLKKKKKKIKKNIVYNLIQNSYVTRNIALGVRKEFVGFDALMTHGEKGN